MEIGNMVNVKVPEDTISKVQAFKKVIDTILEKQLKEESDYIDLILKIGLERMLQDLLPKEEPIAQSATVMMFNRNPQFISDFMVEMLTSGAAIESKRAEKARVLWTQFLV